MSPALHSHIHTTLRFASGVWQIDISIISVLPIEYKRWKNPMPRQTYSANMDCG